MPDHPFEAEIALLYELMKHRPGANPAAGLPAVSGAVRTAGIGAYWPDTSRRLST